MSIIQGNAHTSAGGGTPTGAVERSLRFNSADSAYLSRTPASAGNRRTWTWSCWIKGSAATSSMFSASDGSAGALYTRFGGNGGGIDIGQFNTVADFSLYTNAVTRDYSAWYHIVIAVDTTQATSTNRVKIYINSVEQTSLVGTYPTQNQDTFINSTNAHAVGRFESVGQYLNGYLTEVNFIDGQALTPTSFGETDTNTGVWKPKAYSSTYGTNGFYLKFADNSGTTSTTLGKDSSGNGNNWTPNNFSVTAGAGNDSLVDSPTAYGTDTGVGGEVRGNYATWNPLNAKTTTLTNGNLDGSTTSGMVVGTLAVSSGKWYWECTPTDTTTQQLFGIMSAANTSLPNYPGGSADSYGYYATNGNKYNNSSSSAYGSSYGNGDVIGVALNLDAGTLTFYKNGTTQGTAYSGLSGTFAPASGDGATNAWTANFGQRPFAYTAPSGFKALCTTNLPTPTIGATSTTQANDYFNVVTFNGNGGSNAITGVGFQPDFVWVKSRSNAYSHNLHDVLRGPSSYLVSNSTAAENTSYTNICQFTSDGFTLSADNSANVAGTTNVGWAWDAGGTGVSNTAGTITSTVSANTTSGFSIATLTAQSSGTGTFGHGLGVAPSMVIVKQRASAGTWVVYHTSIGNGSYLILNTTAASVAAASYWNSTSPSSTVVTLGTAWATAGSLVAYCFAPVAGYSAFGSYTGNGSTDGPFVYTGFRPRYVMVKRFTGAGGVWEILDSSRDPYNAADKSLRANASDAEATGVGPIDFLSNGFKLRGIGGQTNDSGTYLYAAFAEVPMKYSLGR